MQPSKDYKLQNQTFTAESIYELPVDMNRPTLFKKVTAKHTYKAILKDESAMTLNIDASYTRKLKEAYTKKTN